MSNAAIIYARYSPGSRQTEQSIEGQLRDCHDFARREGLEVIGEYIDRRITGRTDDRPEFQRLIADSSRHQFSYVIVWKLDRFARNRYDSAIYRRQLRQNGVKVLSAMENIGDSPESVILEAMLEASAEYYSRDLSQKVNRGMRESALKGMSTGAPAPLGYKYVDRRPVVDEQRAEVARHIFELYGGGTPKKQILDELNARGITNSHGGPLTQSTIGAMLRNRKYIGEASWNGVPVDGWPAIIDRELFDRVQVRLDKNKRAPAAKKAKEEYYLQGKAYCGYCGARMVGESGHGKLGATYHYYACADKKKLHTCKKRNERKDFLEWYVVEQTVLHILTPARIDMIAEKVVEEYQKEFSRNRITELETRISATEREMNKLIDQMLETDSKAVRKRIEGKVVLLEQQIDDMATDVTKLKLASGIPIKKEDVIAWLKQFCKGDLMDIEFRRKIIDVFVNSIYVYDDRLLIYYNTSSDNRQISVMGLDDSEIELYDCDGVRILDGLAHQIQRNPNPVYVFAGGLFGCIFSRGD